MPRIYSRRPRIKIAEATQGDFLPVEKDLFWAKVDKSGPCWEWIGRLNHGYGSFAFRKKPVGAHRVSWILSHDRIPKGMWVLHRCNNRKCVNPDHLYLGTVAENVRDMVEARTHSHGSRNSHAKIDESVARSILDAYYFGRRLTREIAASLGLSREHVTSIVAGRFWGLVRDEFVKDSGIENPDALRRSIQAQHKAIAQPRASRHGAAKLREGDVVQIRSSIGAVPYHVLARQFGVAVSTIESVALGSTWRSVTWAPIPRPAPMGPRVMRTRKAEA